MVACYVQRPKPCQRPRIVRYCSPPWELEALHLVLTPVRRDNENMNTPILAGVLPASVANLTALKSFKINRNRLIGAFPSGLLRLHRVPFLLLTRSPSSAFWLLPDLEHVSMSNTALTVQFPPNTRLVNLKSLFVAFFFSSGQFLMLLQDPGQCSLDRPSSLSQFCELGRFVRVIHATCVE